MALYALVRPLAFALDAERAHRLTIRALRLLPPGLPAKRDPTKRITDCEVVRSVESMAEVRLHTDHEI